MYFKTATYDNISRTQKLFEYLHIEKRNHFRATSTNFCYRKLTLKIETGLILMARCSLSLSYMKKSHDLHECGPEGLSYFGCLTWKHFPLNYYSSGVEG